MLLKIAWRNLWRNKRRSIITILAVVFAVMLAIVMRGLQYGTYAVNIKSSVELFSGYLQVQKNGYQKNPSLQKSFHYDANLQKLLAGQPGISGYAPRILGDGLISFRENSLGTAIMAIDPPSERRVSVLMERLNAGQFFTSDSSSAIVVGYKLLHNLQAQIGDTVVILSQGYDGSLGNLKFRIAGSIKSGSPELDGGLVMMGLATAQELLTMYGRINTVAISLTDLSQVAPVQQALSRQLPDGALTVLNWREIMPDLEQTIKLDEVGGTLFLAILVVVVAFGIMNTVLMSVTERFREFGISLAIGMPYRKLVVLVMMETALIALIGILIGNLLAGAINYYIVQHPIIFGGELADLYQQYGFLPRMESSLDSTIFLKNTLIILGVSILMSLYPVFKVYKLEPLKGIRYT